MKPHTFEMFLLIDKVAYKVTPLVPEDGITSAAWRLAKWDGKIYDVATDWSGTECDCADYLLRGKNVGRSCKHIQALRAFGLLEPQRQEARSA